ncbi:MAG: stage III sporulation protein AB [Lachnospiraceae bacterium]|nr:stage III sporulation protein AB [Lachnospiraceae bacterium]
MFELKAAGAVLVLLFGGLMGMSLSDDMKMRISLLREFQKGFLFLHQEMNYLKEPLGEAARHAGVTLAEPFAGFFESMGKDLEELPGVSFFYVWEEKCHQYLDHTALTEGDIDLILQLGRQLNGLDAGDGSRIMAVFEQRLEEAVKEAKETYGSKAQLYRRLGIMGGIFVIILLV